MRRWLVVLVLAAVLVAPRAAWADEEGSQSSSWVHEPGSGTASGWTVATYGDGALD